jgi:hypothetical protein
MDDHSGLVAIQNCNAFLTGPWFYDSQLKMPRERNIWCGERSEWRRGLFGSQQRNSFRFICREISHLIV